MKSVVATQDFTFHDKRVTAGSTLNVDDDKEANALVKQGVAVEAGTNIDAIPEGQAVPASVGHPPEGGEADMATTHEPTVPAPEDTGKGDKSGRSK